MTGLAIIVALYGYNDRVESGAYITKGLRRIRDAEAEYPVYLGTWVGRFGDRRCVDEWGRVGSTNAYGRTLTKHGAPLGGHRWQRRLVRTKAVQSGRRADRRIEEDDNWPPF